MLFMPYVLYMIVDNRYKVAFNHGVELPYSASVLSCSGSRAFILESHTRSEIQLDTADLNVFLSQFTILEDSIERGNIRRLTCEPPIGDILWVQLLEGGYIIIDTDWN